MNHIVYILTVLFLTLGFFVPSVHAAPCTGLPAIGSTSLSNCTLTVASVTGADQANNLEISTTNAASLTLNAGASMTINSGGTLAVGSIVLNGGTIAIASGGSVKPSTPLYIPDADADGFAADLSTLFTSTSSGRRRFSLMRSNSTVDCGDSSFNTSNSCCIVGTYYADADGDGYGAGGPISMCPAAGYVANNTDCNNANASVYRTVAGYLDSDGDGYGAGAYTTCAAATGTYVASGSDCNDASASYYQNLTGYTDADGDGYGTTTPGTVCSGAALPAGYVANNSDCNDSNASIKTIIASGGTVSNITGYKVHTFTSSSAFTISCGSSTIQWLVVAGGGGGVAAGGGGAGGQVRTGSTSMSAGSYTVTVGAGGASGGGTGGNSVFGSITSSGGTYPSGYGDTLTPPAGGTYSSLNGTNTLYGIAGAGATAYGGGWNCSMDNGGPYAGYGYTGVANTGGGGSAGDYRTTGCPGWPGGSGIVIARYAL